MEERDTKRPKRIVAKVRGYHETETGVFAPLKTGVECTYLQTLDQICCLK